MSSCVLDASALLAYLHDEEGAGAVADAIAAGAFIGAANWAETLSKLAEAGHAPAEIAAELESRGLLPGLVEVVPLTAEDAFAIAELRPRTRERGLSLGDRACLALALRLSLPVLTADRHWVDLENVDVSVQPIRP
ncbi:MAG: type II toxin-antitoxin system VapC family toxin [Actinomycetota bacterium]|nr:type II toxin-antitoxin system VapC family toxin [Actinomycetota bacterium]MDQ2981110.1 type II toxin-antitoxin system VapC family toxin [Actinomycetota bacterium]